MGINFRMAVEATCVTRHLMREKGIDGPELLYLDLGYKLMHEDPKRWNSLLKIYELDIQRCVTRGAINSKSFSFKPF